MTSATAPVDPQGRARLLMQQGLIGGVWCAAASGKTFDVTDPATGSTLAALPAMGVEDARRAIAAAADVQPAWRATTARERSSILRRWAELIAENEADLADLLTAEQGKPL